MVVVHDEGAPGVNMASNDAGLKLNNTLAKSSSPYVRQYDPLNSDETNFR